MANQPGKFAKRTYEPKSESFTARLQAKLSWLLAGCRQADVASHQIHLQGGEKEMSKRVRQKAGTKVQTIEEINEHLKTLGGPETEERKVSIIKDHNLSYQELWMEVYIAGNVFEQRAFAEMFVRARCTRAKSPGEADFVVFTGGPDVDPALYGEKKHHKTTIFSNRDTDDINLYVQCLEEGIPMVGVCRGAQFLSVMNGGKLYQHVDNHYGDHGMWDLKNKMHLDKVSSVHHQMVRHNETNGMEVIATSSIARNRWKNDTDNDIGTQADIEAFFYRDTCSFGVQGHPEYRGYNHFAKWFIDRIQDYVGLNPDVDWAHPKSGGNRTYRRLKPDLLAQRDALMNTKAPKLVTTLKEVK